MFSQRLNRAVLVLEDRVVVKTVMHHFEVMQESACIRPILTRTIFL